jgi:uncharacterized protein YjcR
MKDNIIKDYNDGLKVKDMANKYKVSEQWIYSILRNNGIKRNRSSGVAKKDAQAKQAIKEYLNSKGVFKKDIAEKYGICMVTFRKYFKKEKCL